MQTQNTQTSRPFMSIRQAARSTGISEYHLRQMHRDGNLPGFHSGTKYNVDVPRLLDQFREPRDASSGR